tara:strand:- start:418 stop:930 length:513 start_codon:yes stop_codon:yes gene_type:complete
MEYQQQSLEFLPEVSHVNPSQSLASKKVEKISVVSGRKCYDLYQNYIQLGSLVKMCLESSIWMTNLIGVYLTWKVKATPRKRLLFQLLPSVHHTGGTEFGLLPTPSAHEARLGYQDRSTGKKGTQKSLSTVIIDSQGGRGKVTGQLSPIFVEWLMGYPQGWTDCEDLGTQ